MASTRFDMTHIGAWSHLITIFKQMFPTWNTVQIARHLWTFANASTEPQATLLENACYLHHAKFTFFHEQLTLRYPALAAPDMAQQVTLILDDDEHEEEKKQLTHLVSHLGRWKLLHPNL